MRNWKYLSPVKFWPKGISYFPVQAGVKVDKYPGFEISHESLCKLDLHKMFQAGILYRQESKHQVSFCGTAYSWEQQDLVSKQIQTGHRPHKPMSGYQAKGVESLIRKTWNWLRGLEHWLKLVKTLYQVITAKCNFLFFSYLQSSCVQRYYRDLQVGTTSL